MCDRLSYSTIDQCAVDIDTAPPKVRALAKRIRDVGLECHLRSSDNEFGVAYFSAYVLEPDEYDSITVARGSDFTQLAKSPPFVRLQKLYNLV